MKRKLIIGALMITAILPFAGRVGAYAYDRNEKLIGWVYDNDKWYYFNNHGEMEKDVLIVDNDGEYLLGKDGAWIQSEEDKRKLKEMIDRDKAEYEAYKEKYPETNECSKDYKMRDDRWTNRNGNWYFNWKENEFDEEVKDSWEFINGYLYHFNKDGVMDRNTVIKDEYNNDCILNDDGVLVNM